MSLPMGLRWHLWYRRQLRRVHLMRPLSPPSRCEMCDTPFNERPCWSVPDGPRILCAPCRAVFEGRA